MSIATLLSHRRYARITVHYVACFASRSQGLVGARSHLELAHTLLAQVLSPGDTVVDATCGNGYDSTFLASQVLIPGEGLLVCLDVQKQALDNTFNAISLSLMSTFQSHTAETILKEQVRLELHNHCTFPAYLQEESVSAVVYNLGYLPGGDKSIITRPEDSVTSIKIATRTIKVKGIISILAYRGHERGPEELATVEEFVGSLNKYQWSVYRHCPLNWPMSPVLYTLYKIRSTI